MLTANKKSELKIGVALLLFSFIILFISSHNSFIHPYNGWCDPNIYFGGGKAILNGKVLYRDVFDHKGPLIFFIYGIGYLISNANLHGVFILESIAFFICLLFAYKTVKLFLKKEYAFTISLLYGLLLVSKIEMGGSADEFIAPFISVSFYYFISFFRGKTENIYKQMFIHGITSIRTNKQSKKSFSVLSL